MTNINCDALILDELSRSDTVPVMKIDNPSATVAHEATAGKLSEDDLFYLQSRGLSASDAAAAIVNGFISSVTRELPLEFAVK